MFAKIFLKRETKFLSTRYSRRFELFDNQRFRRYRDFQHKRH